MASGFQGIETIERRSLADLTIDRLILAIATNQLPPGARVRENEIAEKLGVSRVPVREAVQRMATQGILQEAGARGYCVAPFDSAHLREVYDLRVALETIMLRQAMPKLMADPALVSPLNHEIDNILRAAETHDAIAINRADLAFHRHAVEVSEHFLGMKTWVGLSRHVQIIFGMEVYRSPDFQTIHAQHVKLRDVLLSGDAEALEAELTDHIVGPRSLIAADAEA
ncbi:MAG: GntR family transcriptional regulator [Alphaproteobacteria bacterium]|nr:GntR family transcriptional regulator [Alphaproteobacteria bacterium]